MLRSFFRPFGRATVSLAQRRPWQCSSLLLCPGRSCGSLTETSNIASASTSLGALAVETPSQSDSYKHLEEQIKGLSPEDQELIMDALQTPEIQPQSKMGGAGIGTRSADMVAAFTCGRCDYRMVKKFSKHAYTKGIVIIECPSCAVRHLIADNLGWFTDEARNVEEILREKGESFVRLGKDIVVEPPSEKGSQESK